MLLSKLKFNVIVFLLTLVNYLIAYLLSSREVVIDYKNIALIFLFTNIWVWLSQKFKSKKAFIGLYISICILGFIVPYLSYLSEAIFLQRLMKDFLFWYSLPLALLAPITWIKLSKKHSLAIASIATIISVIALIPLLSMLVYYSIFETQISADSILAILQTNKQETLEFLKTYLSSTTILLFSILLASIIFTIFKFYNSLFSTTFVPPHYTSLVYL